MSGNNTIQGRSVTRKAAMILDAFAGNRTELSLSDLSRSTGLPSSTVHRLAQELVAWGGLERTARGEYAVGLRLWEIAARASRSYGLREVAMPFLQGLFDVTREHVQLAVLDGRDALLVEKISGAGSVATVGRVGGRLPLHATAVGKVLLAWAPDEVLQSLITSTLTSFTRYTLSTESSIRRELAHVRQEGFAISREEMTLGVVSCATLVTGPQLAAVSVVMPAGARPLREVQQAVSLASHGIAHALLDQGPNRPISAPRTGRLPFEDVAGAWGMETASQIHPQLQRRPRKALLSPQLVAK